MLTQWHEDMATGSEAVDKQHRELLRRVDDLLKGAKSRKGAEEVGRLMWFLKKYVRWHFRDEEKLMLEAGYPGYQSHKVQHEIFFREVLRLESLHVEQGDNTLMIVAVITAMCEWLRSHFNKLDKEFIDFLKDTGQNGNGNGGSCGSPEGNGEQ
ncbi:hemerythrin family protein [Geomonas sp. Red69]|uniref:Hemerythrin family protein n=1 Tax=Geomonas diazotrophica TaxID=2843197 RepID=A0ABX8JM83_9BACT|nr:MULTISPECIES: hemerythrin family protein [Geomonas]MBU5637174.1 hemerythrin family protein [Geomonas diazotrophica]QWV99469.1 hemerythrin family protein [Geomonas nitrogeniifigens]QXE88644.1 hemerythrin family protein [Geomonas nitrogeniifigens]